MYRAAYRWSVRSLSSQNRVNFGLLAFSCRDATRACDKNMVNSITASFHIGVQTVEAAVVEHRFVNFRCVVVGKAMLDYCGFDGLDADVEAAVVEHRSRSSRASLCKLQVCSSWLCIQCIDPRVRKLPV